MSTAEADERPQEIIIVRRGGDDEEGGHHGGAWKIAFADFMTAMMCFFLVMWLINAANDQTKAAVASYFNPVKLVDRSTNSRGLEDDGEGSRDATSVEKPTDRTAGGMTGPEEDSKPAASDVDREFSDENLFSDPYAALAEIAADTGARQNISEKGDGGSQAAGPATGASGGESYRDPFAPDFWTQQVAAPRDALQGDTDTVRADPAAEAEPGSEKPAPTAEDAVTLEKVAAVEPLVETTEKTEAADGPDSGLMDKRRAMAEAIREELIKAFEGASLEAHVAVGATDDGVLITITDDMKHGMFPVGSAVPHRNLVLAMERIGKTLSKRKGSIRINGHTDGRPFSSKTYDNWRLSTARAHAAYYMLVRGGLAERRVVEVAGFADRKLKVPDDPYSDRNRRIEVVLEVPQ